MFHKQQSYYGLKSPSALVLQCKRTVHVCASASCLLLPFVLHFSWVLKLLFHTFLCNSQIITPSVLWMTRCTVALGLWPHATVPSGHPQHLGYDSFDCCIERYEIVVYYIYRIFSDLSAGLLLGVCTKKILFLFLNQYICCGYSKEPSQ